MTYLFLVPLVVVCFYAFMYVKRKRQKKKFIYMMDFIESKLYTIKDKDLYMSASDFLFISKLLLRSNSSHRLQKECEMLYKKLSTK